MAFAIFVMILIYAATSFNFWLTVLGDQYGQARLRDAIEKNGLFLSVITAPGFLIASLVFAVIVFIVFVVAFLVRGMYFLYEGAVSLVKKDCDS